MTIGAFIQAKYKSWGIATSEAELIFPEACINLEDRIDSTNIRAVERALLGKIPELLLLPSSVSELGVSISRANRDAILAYYRYKCRELGVRDVLSEEQSVRLL